MCFQTTRHLFFFSFFFFNDTATTEIYTLSLHDALPISESEPWLVPMRSARPSSLQSLTSGVNRSRIRERDRKSTRLNSSHSQISYAVFCLKKKKNDSISLRDNYAFVNVSCRVDCISYSD